MFVDELSKLLASAWAWLGENSAPLQGLGVVILIAITVWQMATGVPLKWLGRAATRALSTIRLWSARFSLRIIRLSTVEDLQEASGLKRVGSVEPNLRIELEKVHDAIPLYSPEKPGKILYLLIQAWFVNVDSANAVRELSAEIGVKPVVGSHGWKRSHGRWAIGTKREDVGSWTELRPKVDLPSGAVGKLNAFSRWEDQTYIFADDDTMWVSRDSLHVPWDTCFVQIHLRGISFERLFTFRLLSGPTFALLPES